jgi:uncharacterized protein (TIGR03437 family)
MKLRSLLFAAIIASFSLAGAAEPIYVVNGASYDSAQPLAPGAFATVFGENLASGIFSAQVDAEGRLPTSLGGVSVLVNGTPAMLYYVAPGQINFVMPASVAPGLASIMVQNGASVVEGSAMVSNAGPGIFATNGMGMGEAAALHGWLWQLGPFSVTTNGQATQLSLFLTGLDLTTKPKVLVGGVEVEVTYYGNAPGYPGLQQINFVLPANFAGVGRVPVSVESGGKMSNVTYIVILPTTEMMMNWVPGWMPGRIIRENARMGRMVNVMAYNAANHTALVADAEEDVVRVIAVESKTTTATISLPSGSGALGIAVNAAGSMAAAALTSQNSVALIDLGQNKVTKVVSVGFLPGDMAFSGGSLLVTNAGSGSVSVIDTATGQVARNVEAGFGPVAISVAGNLAIVANLQGGSVSLIDLTTYQVTHVTLDPGTRPRDVALTADGKKAVISTPMTNGFLILDVATQKTTKVTTSVFGAMGPGGIAINGNTAYIANQMTSSITVADIASAQVTRTIPVDPGPRDVAVNPARNQLIVLCVGTGVIDVVDLGTGAVTARIDAGLTKHTVVWSLPTVTSISPNKAAAGSNFTLTLNGFNLASVKNLVFEFVGPRRLDLEDTNIKVTNVQAKADGTQVTANVQILSAAAAGQRFISLVTDQGEMRPPFSMTLFTVTK